MVFVQEKPTGPTGVTIEAWSGGWMVGALIIMACVTIVNMRRKVLLHKLILVELFIGMPVGTFIFTPEPIYHWYLSITALFLYISWSLHNVIAWMKNKPFLNRKASRIYIFTVLAVQPFWIFEMVANFLYFGGWSKLFTHSRPFEPLFRDPWWVFTVCDLFWNIHKKYDFAYVELIRVSPRFGILLGAMVLSLCFMVIDILSVTSVIPSSGLPDGINPFWKFAYIFKCLTDTIVRLPDHQDKSISRKDLADLTFVCTQVLDDFKTALDRLAEYKLERMGSIFSDGIRGDFNDVVESRQRKGHAHNPSATSSRSMTDQRMSSLPLRSPHASKARDWTELNDVGCMNLESALHIDNITEKEHCIER